jgi:hypothetical protein
MLELLFLIIGILFGWALPQPEWVKEDKEYLIKFYESDRH